MINLKILGSIPSFVFNNQHVIALPKKWNIDPSKPVEFEVGINEKEQLVLLGPSVSKPNNTQVSTSEEIDDSD